MAGTIFGSLQTGYSGLQVNQQMVDTTSHNLANANNSHYTRQRVVASALAPGATGLEIGQGSMYTRIVRVHEEFKYERYKKSGMEHEQASLMKDTLEEVSKLFPELQNVGIKNDLKKYFDSWNSLTTNPTSTAEKVAVVKAAEQLAHAITTTRENLFNVQLKLNDQLDGYVSEINEFLEQQVKELMSVDAEQDSWNIYKISHIYFINSHLQVLVSKLKKALKECKPEDVEIDDANIKALAVNLYKSDIKGKFVIYSALMDKLFDEMQNKNPNEMTPFIMESGSLIVDANGGKWQYPFIIDLAGTNSLLNNIKLAKLLLDTQDKKEQEIKDKFGELDEVKAGFEESEEKYFELEEELKSMQEELKSLKRELPEIKKEKDTLYEQLTKLQGKKGPKDPAVQAKQQEYSKVGRDYHTKTERVEELEPLIKKEQVTFENIEANYKVYNSRMESLNKKLQDFDVKYADMDKKFLAIKKNMIQNFMKKRQRVV
jgi:DNA repair exonuclease SbcCD ATPase subunit